MAEIVVSALVGVLFEKLASMDLMNLARSQGIDSQLNKWNKNLAMIQAVLADAAQKQITQKAVELWLTELQDLAYDIDDVLDDIATEAMKRKFQESCARTRSSKLLMVLPSCCARYAPRNIMYGHDISSKLDEITARLRDLVEQKNNLGLNVNVEGSKRTNKTLEETSLPDLSEVLGREGDKEALLGKMLEGEEEECSERNVGIVSIVGMGGIGKTTLARLLYNDDKVKDHFEVKAWVCVSDEFDVFDISKAIYQGVGGEEKQFATLDLLHVALKENLLNKRFLLVLDNVWNEDHKKWEVLRRPLFGAPGSKIIVTTRKTTVASVMNSVQLHYLGVLSDEVALTLFAKYALDEENFDKHPSLVSIARGIIKKCDGLPLALIALGRVLKNKGTKDDKWAELLNSEIWDLQDESNILPALKLSYYDLPLHLKQLFAYCSLVPKNYVFKKNKLVLLWMAEGFLSQGNKTMESLGCQYFEELLSRSFFQRSTYYYESRYTMHDLMNDLAVSVAGKLFFKLDDNKDVNDSNKPFEKLRHLSFVGQRDAKFRKFKELRRATCLRTFLPLSVGWKEFNTLDNVLHKLQLLRVLSLTGDLITKVPESIGNLKHLRYLNFSKTSIKHITEEVSDLYNLQSLLVCDCRQLSSLPVSFIKLKNLRHLDMTNTPSLKKTPLGIGGSTSLQTLPKVYVEGGNGFKVSELMDLSHLKGKLSIKGLDKVTDPIEANNANLQQKEGLDDLDMEWSDVFGNPTIEYDVLESLRAPSKLKKLSFSFYGGMKFPSWVGNPTSFDQLTELTLRGCENCTELPTLGHLSSLRKLCLISMKAVKTVGFELLAPTKPFHGPAFPSLESLEVDDMQSLEIWSTSGGDNDETATSFLSLRVISIKGCPKLAKVSFGLIPSLKDVTIEECPEAVLKDMVGVSASICRLNLKAIKGLTQLDREVLKHLGAVEDLSIRRSHELRYLWESESEVRRLLGSLKKLYVYGCKKLVLTGEKEVIGIMGSLREVIIIECEKLEGYCCPNSVEKLEIRNCDSMTSLTVSKLQDEPPSSSALKMLSLIKCKNLKSVPHEHFQSLASLEKMVISDCPSMECSFPCRSWPPNLKKLFIGRLKKPMSEWGHQNYPASLVHLTLLGENSGVVSFATEQDHVMNNTFILPPSLSYLSISDFERAESVSEVLQHLPCLGQLFIIRCPKLKDAPKTSSSLTVNVCR